MRKCRFCHEEIEDATIICPHCGRNLVSLRESPAPPVPAPVDPQPRAIPIALDPALSPAPIARVSVVDINMPFASMVGFMVKWTLAAIPAILILAVILGGLIAALVSIGVRAR